MVKSEDESAWDACTITVLTDKNLTLEYDSDVYGEHWKEQYVKIK